jgi:ABC-2 type transport system permease protein
MSAALSEGTIHAAWDSATMLRRDVRHSLRRPSMTISGMAVPLVFLLLFVGVFGNTLRAGLYAMSQGSGTYIDYLAPGIIVMTAGASAAATAINVCMDMREGIITRFRTMGIARGSVLTGQVVGSLGRTLVSAAAVTAVAVGLGFRPSADWVEWLAAVGMFILLTLALTWLAMAFGLVANTPAGANSLSLIPEFLPFVSSAFVPTASMPAGVRWFAEHQPFTPVIETLRGLLTGVPIGNNALLAVIWCAAIAVAAYLRAYSRYNRLPAR